MENTLSLEELLKRDYIYLATDKYFESWYSEVEKIHTSEIEKRKLSETYGFDGNTYGSYDAGDWIDVTDDNVEQINDIITKYNEEYDDELDTYEAGGLISAFDDSEVFNLLEEAGVEIEGIEVYVYNFWNGHNWESYVLDCDEIDEAINVWVIDKLDVILKLDSIDDFESIHINDNYDEICRQISIEKGLEEIEFEN